MMPIERKQIIKQYLLLCEGKDAEQFLEEIKFHTITTQYMFATDRAIGLLKAL